MMAFCLFFPTLPTAMTRAKSHRNNGTAHQVFFKRRPMAPLQRPRRPQLRYKSLALFTGLPNKLLCYHSVAPDRRQEMDELLHLLSLASPSQ